MPMSSRWDGLEAAVRAAQSLRLVILDVDGVLTDGSLYLDQAGVETKGFYVRDGHGLKLLKRFGLELAIITARHSPAVAYRAHELGIQHVYQGYQDKCLAYTELKIERGLEDEVIAYMGDDLVDLPILARAGLPAAPADAHPEVLSRARFVSRLPGGRGAVRELCDFILQAQGKWQEVMAEHLRGERV